jgi:hypothetical protein
LRERLGRADLRLLLGLLLVSRLAVVPVRVALLAGSEKYFDFRHYFELARMSDQGFYPYIHYWMEYPPVFPWLTVAIYKLGALFASGIALEAWFYGVISLLFVAAEAAILVVTYRLSLHLSGAAAAWRSALIYLLCFLPIYLWNGWFDALPTLVFVLALYLLVTGRRQASAAATGLGLITKIFPGLLAPLALCVLPGARSKMRYVVIALGVAVAGVAPLALAAPSMMATSLRAMLGRPSWETVWALLEGYYGFGAVAPFADRLDPATATAGSHASTLPWGLVTAVFAVLFALVLWRAWGKDSPRQVVAAAGSVLALLLIYNKGYSPQYLMWIAPLLAVLWPGWKGAAYLALLSAINLVEYPLYFHFFPTAHWVLAVAVAARTVMLFAIGLDCLRLVSRPQTVNG